MCISQNITGIQYRAGYNTPYYTWVHLKNICELLQIMAMFIGKMMINSETVGCLSGKAIHAHDGADGAGEFKHQRAKRRYFDHSEPSKNAQKLLRESLRYPC